MIKFDNENYVKNLPDKYRKAENSNNDKILSIERLPAMQLKQDVSEVLNALDLDNATGKTLDLYGDMLGQARGMATDEQYRTLIRSKIAQSLSGGDYPSVLNALCVTFNCDPSEVLIIEREEAAAVEVAALPIGAINSAGFTIGQAIAIFKRILPIGTTVTSYAFVGTFEFSDSEAEQSTTAGFRNDESDETQGGYFGEVFSDDSGVDLPI